MRTIIVTTLLAAALGSTPVFAQAPAAGAVPKHSCTKPADYPGNLASDNQKNSWRKEYIAYTECLKKFVTEEQAFVKPHLDAVNAAADEYNAAVKQYNDTIEKAKAP
jgi:hypothetical protein